jgi:uncharacterized protein (TIGR03067 family)
LLTGRAPFAPATVIDTLVAQQTSDPKPIPGLPAGLWSVLAKMMAKRPEDRYQTADEVVAALEPFAASTPIKPRRRWPIVALAAAASLALVAAGIVFYLQTRDGTVRFEINDPAIQVVIDRDGHTITGADKDPIKVSVGSHRLHITRGDFVFDTSSFEMKKGKETTVKIDFMYGTNLKVVQDGREIGNAVVMTSEQPPAAKTNRARGWVSLFNGKDIVEWKATPTSTVAWQVENGILIGSGPVYLSQLRTLRADYADFHLRTELKLSKNADARLLLRHEESVGGHRGYEAYLATGHGDATPTLDSYAAGRAGKTKVIYHDPKKSFPLEAWFILEVIADHERITVKVNGEEFYSVVDNNSARGQIGFVIGGGSTRIEIRKIEIKELPDTQAAKSDKEAILGAWRGVAVELGGEAMPREFIDMVKPTLTFSSDKVIVKPQGTIPKQFLEAAIAKGMLPPAAARILENGEEGVYHLDPAKSPKQIDFTILGEMRRTGLGIYSLDGDTLKVCMSLDPAKVDQRPKEFAAKPGEMRAIITLKRITDADPTSSPKSTPKSAPAVAPQPGRQ